MNKFLVFVVATTLLLTGCGSKNNGYNAKNASYSYAITYSGHFYSVTGSYVQHVGKQIGIIRKFVKGSNLPQYENSSNDFPSGSKIYEIPGKNVNETIAVRAFGKYAEVKRVHK